MFAHSSRPFGVIADAETTMEKGNDLQRSFLRMKRRMCCKDIEKSKRYMDASHLT